MGPEIKPGRQSEDDRTPRGIFRNSSVGLCRDPKPLNKVDLENGWNRLRDPEILDPTSKEHGDPSSCRRFVNRLFTAGRAPMSARSLPALQAVLCPNSGTNDGGWASTLKRWPANSASERL